MKRVVLGVTVAAVGAVVAVRRRRAAHDEQLLWNEAATSPAPRDLR